MKYLEVGIMLIIIKEENNGKEKKNWKMDGRWEEIKGEGNNMWIIKKEKKNGRGKNKKDWRNKKIGRVRVKKLWRKEKRG